MILEKSYYDVRFKYFVRNIIKTDTLTRADLYFYLSKDKTFYTFYFLRPIKFGTLTNKYVFEKKYDSINIYKENIHIGNEGYNTFMYTNEKIVFKSHTDD